MTATRRLLLIRLAKRHNQCLFRFALAMRRVSTPELGMLMYGE